MLIKTTLAIAALALGMGSAHADDYLNFQGANLVQTSIDDVDLVFAGDVTQDAKNIGNTANMVDNDDFNDNYGSAQFANVLQFASNDVDVFLMDDLEQSATNAGNALNIDDDDGVIFAGDQEVNIFQGVNAVQGALNVAEFGGADDLDQSALNVGNQVTLDFDHPDANLIDVSSFQTANVLQGSVNTVSGFGADTITQSATNVGNSFSSIH